MTVNVGIMQHIFNTRAILRRIRKLFGWSPNIEVATNLMAYLTTKKILKLELRFHKLTRNLRKLRNKENSGIMK